MTSKIATYKLGPKGQVVIPKPIRDRMDMVPGDRVMVDEDRGVIRIRKVVTDPAERRAIVEGLRGILGGGKRDLVAELEADHRREIQADEREMRERGL